MPVESSNVRKVWCTFAISTYGCTTHIINFSGKKNLLIFTHVKFCRVACQVVTSVHLQRSAICKSINCSRPS